MKILITGGAGYIGSHTLVDVLVVNSLVNGHAAAIARVGQLTNTQVPLDVGDIRDKAFMECVFADFRPDAVIHLAGLKAVGASVADPLSRYDVNVRGSQVLLEVADLRNIYSTHDARRTGFEVYVSVGR